VRSGVSVDSAAGSDNLPQLDPDRRTNDPSTSMTAFFEYLHDHKGTTELAKALASVAMLRTTGARPVRVPGEQQRIAS
jgi:hypothetical protein